MVYGEIFTEVGQRVNAFLLYREFVASHRVQNTESQRQYLEDAYTFLYTTASRRFIEYCARREDGVGIGFWEYCNRMGIDTTRLVDEG